MAYILFLVLPTTCLRKMRNTMPKRMRKVVTPYSINWRSIGPILRAMMRLNKRTTVMAVLAKKEKM